MKHSIVFVRTGHVLYMIVHQFAQLRIRTSRTHAFAPLSIRYVQCTHRIDSHLYNENYNLINYVLRVSMGESGAEKNLLLLIHLSLLMGAHK